MNLRLTAIVVIALATPLLYAQKKVSSDDLHIVKPFRGKSRPVSASPIDTRDFFPQISQTMGKKLIRPSNPSPRGERKPGLGGGGIDSMTTVQGTSPGALFPGIGMTGYIPADNDIAVGPSHIVQVVNTTFAFFTKAGTATFSQDSPTFFAGVAASNGHFDPKVIYDNMAQRFVIVILEQNAGPKSSTVLIAVSDDSDPNGVWYRYSFSVQLNSGGKDYWLDYPGVGYNNDGYVISGNYFGFTAGFWGNGFLTIPKAPLLIGGIATGTVFADDTIMTGIPPVGPQMAEMDDPASPYVFGANRDWDNDAMSRFYAFSDIGGTPAMVFQDFPMTSSPWPTAQVPSTGGAVLDTVDSRFHTVRYVNSRLWTTNNHSNTPVGIRWSEFDMGTWPTAGSVTEVTAGNYVSGGTLNYIIGAVNVNKHNDVSILMSSADATVTSDIVVAGRVSIDPAGSMSAPSIMKSATGSPYNHSRWGDYNDVDVDPADGETFWGTAMYVRPDGWWNTEIVSWTVSKTTVLAPTAATWTFGSIPSGSNADLGADDGSYFAASAGFVLFQGQSPAQLVVDTVVPAGQVLDLDLTVDSHANSTGLAQTIEFWNYISGSYDVVGTQATSLNTDAIQMASAGGTLSDYVEAGTNAVRARISWKQSGFVLLYPWRISVDEVDIAIRTR